MRSVVRVNPFAEVNQVAEMIERAFGDLRAPQNGAGSEPIRAWSLPVDVYERDNALVIRTAIPGVKPENVNVSIEENVLTIAAETQEEITEQDRVFRREFRHGKFSRSLLLPEDIDTSGIEASFDHGFVRITLPKITPVKPVALKIPVKYVTDSADEPKPADEAGSE